jgi:hypothetical protein
MGPQMYQGAGYGFIAMCMAAHLDFTSHCHQFSNILIRSDSKTAARSETYCDVTLRRKDENGLFIDLSNLGRYIDHWEKREGAWRISRRHFLLDFDQAGPGGSLFQPTGKRDRTDPGYFGAL